MLRDEVAVCLGMDNVLLDSGNSKRKEKRKGMNKCNMKYYCNNNNNQILSQGNKIRSILTFHELSTSGNMLISVHPLPEKEKRLYI